MAFQANVINGVTITLGQPMDQSAPAATPKPPRHTPGTRLPTAAAEPPERRAQSAALRALSGSHSGLEPEGPVQLHRDRVGEGLEAAALAGQLIRRLCQGLTLGPYLRPSLAHIPVYRYWTPEEFEGLGAIARELGFASVRSGPLVRSSYHAGT